MAAAAAPPVPPTPPLIFFKFSESENVVGGSP